MSLTAQVLSTQTPVLAAGPTGPLQAASGGSACPPITTAQSVSAEVPVCRGVPVPHWAPKGSLGALGRVRGAAWLCPQRAALSPHCSGGRLRTRLSPRSVPRRRGAGAHTRGRRRRCPSGCSRPPPPECGVRSRRPAP